MLPVASAIWQEAMDLLTPFTVKRAQEVFGLKIDSAINMVRASNRNHRVPSSRVAANDMQLQCHRYISVTP